MDERRDAPADEAFKLHNCASAVLDGFFDDLLQGVPALQAMELALKNLQAAQMEDTAEKASLRSETAATRDAALEEAAKECEVEINYGPVTVPKSHWQCAAAIRALKNAAPQCSAPEPAEAGMQSHPIQGQSKDREPAAAVSAPPNSGYGVVKAHADQLHIIADVSDQYLHPDYGKQLRDVANAIDRQCDKARSSYRPATLVECLITIKARLSEHLSPAEQRELQEAAEFIGNNDEPFAVPSSAETGETPRTDDVISDPMTERESKLFQHARQLERELAVSEARVYDLIDAARTAPLSSTAAPNTYDVVADAVQEIADAAEEAFKKAGLTDPGEWDSDNIVQDVKLGIVSAIGKLAALRSAIRAPQETFKCGHCNWNKGPEQRAECQIRGCPHNGSLDGSGEAKDRNA